MVPYIEVTDLRNNPIYIKVRFSMKYQITQQNHSLGLYQLVTSNLQCHNTFFCTLLFQLLHMQTTHHCKYFIRSLKFTDTSSKILLVLIWTAKILNFVFPEKKLYSTADRRRFSKKERGESCQDWSLHCHCLPDLSAAEGFES